jgi:hypothetical protein
MFSDWSQFVEVARIGLQEITGTDFSQVRYGNLDLAVRLATAVAVLAGLSLIALLTRRHRHSRLHSGYALHEMFGRPLWVRILHAAPKVLLAAALVLLLIAVADPFLTATEEAAASVESRVRVDLVDTSGSMGWEFAGTGKSKAEIAREAHLAFLEMRRAKNDRVSLWLFSTFPYMVDDFVTDDELYYYQVVDAPLVISRQLDRSMVVPLSRTRIIPDEGGSNIVRPMQAIIKQFDQDEISSGHAGGRHRALLVMTDAAVDDVPSAELAELAKRNIVPYVILISAPDATLASFVPPTVPRLVEQLRAYGGEYFDVREPTSLAKAYAAIDAREAVRYRVVHRARKVPIYPRFVIGSMLLMLMAVPLGLVGEQFWGTDP